MEDNTCTIDIRADRYVGNSSGEIDVDTCLSSKARLLDIYGVNAIYILHLVLLAIEAIAGTIASGAQFVSDGSVKKTIAERFSAIACEMESGGIAQACYIAGVPCAVIRSISDTADGDSADYEKFKYEAAEQAEALLKKVLTGIPKE